MINVTLNRLRVSELEDLIKTWIREVILESYITPAKEKDKILNAYEAAEFLKITIPTVYTKASRGEIPFMKNGSRLYFSESELLKHIQSGKSKAEKAINTKPGK